MQQWMSTGYGTDAGESCQERHGRQEYGARTYATGGYAAEERTAGAVGVSRENAAQGPEKAEGSFAETIAEKLSSSPKEMSLWEYKVYFYEKAEALCKHPSQKNVFWYIDITDAAYQRMQMDPNYEQKVLDYLGKQKAVNYGSHPPRFIYAHIDDSWEKCYGYSLGVSRDERYERYEEARRREAKARAKKARKKKLLKEYLEKRARQKRLLDKLLEEQLAKKRREHIRLERMWCEKRQRIRAARAYEASQIMLCRREQPL